MTAVEKPIGILDVSQDVLEPPTTEFGCRVREGRVVVGALLRGIRDAHQVVEGHVRTLAPFSFVDQPPQSLDIAVVGDDVVVELHEGAMFAWPPGVSKTAPPDNVDYFEVYEVTEVP